MLSISAVWPPLPRTMRRWVGETEGGGREVGRGRERMPVRWKNERLVMRIQMKMVP